MALTESDYSRLFSSSQNEGQFVRESKILLMQHFTDVGNDYNLPKDALVSGVRKYILAVRGKKSSYPYPIRSISPMRAAAATIMHEYANDIAEKARQHEEENDGFVKQLSSGFEAIASAVLTAESAKIRGISFQTTLNLQAVARVLPEELRSEYTSQNYDLYERITARRVERLDDDPSGRGVVFGEAGDILALSVNLSPYHNHESLGHESVWTKVNVVGAESATIAYNVFYKTASEVIPAAGIKI